MYRLEGLEGEYYEPMTDYFAQLAARCAKGESDG
jgi:hypothetical protein